MLELRNCWLADGRKNVVIRIASGKIQSIGSEDGWPCFMDLEGLMVLPGLIDVHVHDRTPDTNESEDWESLPRAAAWGGVTAICKMPNTKPSLSTAERLDESFQEIGVSSLPCKVWFGATPTNQKEIALVAHDPRVAGVKMYMGSSTGDLLVDQPDDQQRIFEVCSLLGAIVAVHAEDEALLLENRRLLGRQPLLSDHCLLRNTVVEVEAVKRALRLAKETDCKLHLLHISTPEAVELARDAKDAGVRVTVGVCPHHLVLNDQYLRRTDAGHYKMNPPLRTEEQRRRLTEYVFRPDFVDIIESDHAPHPCKERGEYDMVPSGVPGIATILPIMLKLVQQQPDYPWALNHMVKLCSTNPAKLAGFASKGRVVEGADADLIAIDPFARDFLGGEATVYKCGWTPYEGLVAGRLPKLVIAGGKVVNATMAIE